MTRTSLALGGRDDLPGGGEHGGIDLLEPLPKKIERGRGLIVDECVGAGERSRQARAFLPLPAAEPCMEILAMIVVINIGLAAFNLIPIPPLDGYGFVTNLLPKSMAVMLRPLETYGPLILLAVIFLGPSLLHVDVLGSMLRPIQSAIIFLMKPARPSPAPGCSRHSGQGGLAWPFSAWQSSASGSSVSFGLALHRLPRPPVVVGYDRVGPTRDRPRDARPSIG